MCVYKANEEKLLPLLKTGYLTQSSLPKIDFFTNKQQQKSNHTCNCTPRISKDGLSAYSASSCGLSQPV
jgi:hypothetical protein